MYVSDVAAREALADRSMFNIVDPESGWKVDLIVRKLRPFSEQEFARRQSVTSSAYDSTLRLWKT